MKLIAFFLLVFLFWGCNSDQHQMKRIIFLHHSTGQAVWIGETNRYARKFLNRSDVKTFFKRYNKENGTNYLITERSFPQTSPYGWRNNPYDYYNIWVKNAGDVPYMNEPTLEMLTKTYDIVIFKHCYPVSKIQEDTGVPDINSSERRLENYKLQYTALKNKMHEFSSTKFIVWTPPVHVKKKLSPEEAERTREFYRWLVDEWDEKEDNIILWDFYKYETEGGLYMQDKYARAEDDSHPNKEFAGRMAQIFSQFIIDVADGKIK